MTNTKGGKRKGAGRKPVKDKKLLLPLYVRQSAIKRKGKKYLQETLTAIAEK